MDQKIKYVLILLLSIVSILCAPMFVSASSQVSVQGTATIINTEGLLDFSNYNSNAVVETSTGNISGYVWSEDIGWIDFDNNGNSSSTSIDLEDGIVTGLAYAINTGALIDFTNYNSNVVVDLRTGSFSGYAWSEDVGWIDFSNVQTPNTLAASGKNILPILFGSVLTLGILLLLLKEELMKTRYFTSRNIAL